MPNRRPTATWNIEFEQQQLTGTIGYDPETGIPREAFFSTRAKAGTLLDGLLYDAGVLLSLAFQYGTTATALAKSVARLEDGSPASPVGELIDVIVKEVEAAHQSNSRALRTPTFRQRKIRPKKGRGSYSRVKRPLSHFYEAHVYHENNNNY